MGELNSLIEVAARGNAPLCLALLVRDAGVPAAVSLFAKEACKSPSALFEPKESANVLA